MKRLLKKCLSAVLAITIVFGPMCVSLNGIGVSSVVAGGSFWNIGACGNNLGWAFDDGVLTITGEGDMWGFEAKNQPWYNINSDIEVVVISEGVTSIGENSFNNCKNLTSITIPDSVTNIGDGAFVGCTSLVSITIPDSVISIGNIAFGNCKNLVSIVIPNSVTTLGTGAFMGCSSLQSIVISDKVTSIFSFTFWGCTSLTSITIPDSVTYIDPSDLEKTPYYNDADNWENGVLYIGNHLVAADTSLEGIYEIKPGTKNIAPYAFVNCTNLTAITIPDSVTNIGCFAFYDCTNLTTITIPDSVTNIGDSAFGNCTNIKAVYIADIEKWCCIDFDEYGFESNPLHNGGKLYLNDKLVSDVVFSNNLTVVKDYTFAGYTYLTSISIPDSVTSIGEYAFLGCTSLESITIPDSVTSIGGGAFDSCTSLTSIEIPNGVTSIGEYAFYSCTNLTSIVIPDSVTSIGGGTFDSCTSLASIVIPDSVTSIGAYAFYDCTNLTSIEIPDSVTSVGESAFQNTGYCLDNSNWENGLLYIDEFLISAKASGACEIKLGTETIVGGAFSQCTNLTSVIIPDSVTSIGECAFRECTSLTSITIPDSVTSIGECAFRECTSLTSITIPDSVTSIGYDAFHYTGYYENTDNWENGVLYINNHFIASDDSLSDSYEIRPGTKTIADSAFDYFASLITLIIPDSVVSIGEGVFTKELDLKYIFYSGFEGDWANVAIGDYNSLEDVAIHYNTTAEHTYSDEWTTVIAPTCEEIGYKFQKCLYCNEIGNEDIITQLGHDYKIVNLADAAPHPHLTTFKCSLCEKTEEVNYTLPWLRSCIECVSPFGETEDTEINFTDLIIRTKVNGADEITDILIDYEFADITIYPSYVYGDVELYGTGTIISVSYYDYVWDFTLMVDCDTNGDSVCDALDCAQIALVSNGLSTIDGAYKLAADSNSDNVVDIDDYQAVVNRTLAS